MSMMRGTKGKRTRLHFGCSPALLILLSILLGLHVMLEVFSSILACTEASS